MKSRDPLPPAFTHGYVIDQEEFQKLFLDSRYSVNEMLEIAQRRGLIVADKPVEDA